MSGHPYRHLPDHAFWRRTVAAGVVAPALPASFSLNQLDKVATAGSCFAQEIGPMLRGIGFNWLITEMAHPMITPALAIDYGYGRFSARFGNIYTARQLVQLYQRAYDEFIPAEDVWEGDGVWTDPFRPQIQPGGFLSRAEFAADRAQHFAAVREMFETLDVFVFTLGLTEAWVSAADGAVFTLCPGVAGGTYDPVSHRFHNFSAAEFAEDLEHFIKSLRTRNPAAKVILTVSPVPLVATATAGHVMVATMTSKSRLHAAATTVASAVQGVAYFPSYEIVMAGAYGGDSYFDPVDRRSVTGPGKIDVLRAFAASFAGITLPVPARWEPPADAATARMAALMAVHCDELMLDSA